MGSETSIGIILIGCIFVFFMQSAEINKRHIPIKILFNLISVWLVTTAINIATQLAVNDGLPAGVVSVLDAVYIAVFVVAWVVTVYLIVFYVKDVLMPRIRGNEETEFINNEKREANGWI